MKLTALPLTLVAMGLVAVAGAQDDFDCEEPYVYEPILVTMDFDNIPLGEAIRYICAGAGLKYKVDSHAVIIASQNVPFDEMETRFYAVSKRFGKLLPTGHNTELVAYFRLLGLTFPDGAQIQHIPRLKRLIAVNDPGNLRKLEQIIAQLDLWTIQKDFSKLDVPGEQYPRVVALGPGRHYIRKLSEIVLPKTSFDEANIREVVKYLSDESRRLDPSGTGINIFLQLDIGADEENEYEEVENCDETDDNG